MMEFVQIIHTSNNISQIRKEACSALKEILNCEAVFIYRFDEDKKCLRREFRDSNGEFFDYSYTVDDSTLHGSCAFHSSLLHVNNVQDEIRYHKIKSHYGGLECHEFLMAPLVHNGLNYGVVKCINKIGGEFSAIDAQFLEALAGQLTMVVLSFENFEKFKKQTFQIIEAFADAIGKKDTYTGGHTKRVSQFAEEIGKNLNLSFDEMHDLKLASRLHDIGKIGIPDRILRKKDPLNDEEFEVMRNHPAIGFEILGHIKSLKKVTDGMRYHHERPDGKGYPYGLQGNEIPKIAHIISVADTFDAMISTRPYRKGMDPMIAYAEILKYSGTQFDEEAVKGFKKFFEKTRMYRPKKKAKKAS